MVAVEGSERRPLPGAQLVGPADPDAPVLVTLQLLRSRTDLPDVDVLGAQPIAERRHLSHDELRAGRKVEPADVALVESFAQRHGLEVGGELLAGGLVRLAGPAKAMGAAFGVELDRYEYSDGSYRGRVGPVHVPPELEHAVNGVFGLDDRPQSRLTDPAAVSDPKRFSPTDVAKLYEFPAGADGSGQTVAVLQFGGGFRSDDLETYCRRLGVQVPEVDVVSVAGAGNALGSPRDAEVLLDLELVASLAPGARIAVYFAPNTEQGWLEAVTTAVHDGRANPSAISISWGTVEARWTQGAMRAVDRAFADAALLGITVCCASGDRGSSAGVDDGGAHVSFPGSSPHALSCGGTTIDERAGAIADEVAWSNQFGASGGGVSAAFPRPRWQRVGVPGTGRAVPDVAGNATPGYELIVGGRLTSAGGTSAVAPLWAALVARMNEKLGTRVGFLNPLLYGEGDVSGALRDITSGSNGAFQAGVGWDAVTGWGSPHGSRLLDALSRG